MEVGASATIEAVLTPEGATGDVEWQSSDETVVTLTVSEDGMTCDVDALATGTATITVSCGELTDTASVTVTEESNEPQEPGQE